MCTLQFHRWQHQIHERNWTPLCTRKTCAVVPRGIQFLSCIWWQLSMKFKHGEPQWNIFYFLHGIQKYLGMLHLILIKINHCTWYYLLLNFVGISQLSLVSHKYQQWLSADKLPGQPIVHKTIDCKLVSLFKCSISNWEYVFTCISTNASMTELTK